MNVRQLGSDASVRDAQEISDEQERAVVWAETDAVARCMRWQAVMAILYFALTNIMFATATRQLFHPWDLRHHTFFRGAVPSGYLALGEYLSGLSYLLAGCLFFEPLTIHSSSTATDAATLTPGKGAAANRAGIQSSLPVVAVTFGFLVGLLWAYDLARAVMVKHMPWSGAVSYVWLPLGPPLGASLACMVRGMLHRRLEDLQGLRMQ